jgi:2-polyprenyl-3-methyl-5-hydroxy-6-metoxy-1,4-benzoquinol methylase
VADPGARARLRITGVDYDAEALQIRRERQQDLAEAIVGDLRTVELPAGHFDVAYCAFVLEHVEGAELVLDRLLAALRPGGRLIVLVPNARSVYGWAARTFPFWAAVAYKKYVEGFADAGKPGHAPYPVVYERSCP